jgi:rhodanese-related sulfurtransferase
VPGALLVERNVLEWRFDPRSGARLPEASGYDARVIIMCSEGYASSLAAASLQDLGLRHATDIIGGFRAWVEASLPVIAPASTASHRAQ